MSSESQEEQREISAADVLRMAIESHQRMDYGNARRLYERVLSVWPDCPDALHFLGLLIYNTEKDLVRALELMERSIALSPQHPDFHNNYGNLLKVGGRTQDAMAAYRRTLDLRPGFPDACNNLGLMLQKSGDSAGAIARFEEAIRENPDHIVAYLNLGNILGVLDRWEEAEATFRTVIKRWPTEAEGHFRLVWIYWQQGRIDDAIRKFGKKPKNASERSDRLVWMAQLFSKHGQANETIKALRMAIDIFPKNWSAFHALGIELNHEQRFDEAMEVWQRWAEGDPKNPIPRHHLAARAGGSALSRAEDAYITTTFDRYANNFDAQLALLNYRAPEIVAEALKGAVGGAAGLDILDAGCGTGLCGPLLRPIARRLTGVDLSKGMLEKARERGGYDGLDAAELTGYLNAKGNEFDAIVSADTLCYFGELRDALRGASRALRAGGHLVFTVEELVDESAADQFRIEINGRFTHSRGYIGQAMKDAGFPDFSISSANLRMEYGKPVKGLVVVARKAGGG